VVSGDLDESHAVVAQEPLPRVFGNAGQITRVFQNLVSNAVKFRRPGSGRASTRPRRGAVAHGRRAIHCL
jgi:signal transduction histidine kinase